MALNDKQSRFVEEYLVDFNGTQAAIRAGYSSASAYSQAHDLLKKPEIQEALAAGRQELSDRTGLTRERIVEELAKVALADIRDVALWAADGEVQLVASDVLSDEAAGAIREVHSTSTTITFGESGERTTVVRSVKQHDKMRALELLGKHLGVFSDAPLLPDDLTVTLVWPEQA